METGRVALVIGVGNYENCGELKYCPPSAREVYELLINPDHGCCDPDRSILLIGENEKLTTADNIRESLNVIKLSEKDQFIFFFCGHGKVSNDELILLMSNYSEENKNNSNTYKFQEIIGELKDKKPNKSIMIIDTCHSEAMLTGMRLYQDPSISFMWSCRKGERARQAELIERTYFSYYFCKGIKELEGKDGIELRQLNNYIKYKIDLQRIGQLGDCYGAINSLISKGAKEYDETFPFVNRVLEIDSIIEGNANPYQIIDAPAGYGKTVLLRELKKRLEKKGVFCVLMQIKNKEEINKYKEEFIKDFLFLLNNNSELVGKDIDTLCINIRNEIRSITIKNKDKDFLYNFVLMIDFIEKPCLDMFKFLAENFIPEIIKGFEFTKKIKFLISGRYISNQSVSSEGKIQFSKKILGVFCYDVVKDAVLNFYIKKNICSEEELKQSIPMAAAHLMFFCGGHPGCITYMLDKYIEDILSPDIFFRKIGKEICKKKVIATANEIRNFFTSDSFTSNLEELVDQFSVFRYADNEVVKNFFGFKKEKEADTFIKILVGTHLFSVKDHLIHDDIIRRILAIRFQSEKKDVFSICCEKAKKICLYRILEIKNSEHWVVEYLFQIFQDFAFRAEYIENQRKRIELKEKVFKYDLKCVLQHYVDQKERLWVDQTTLKDKLQGDKELSFLVNYCLRDKDDNYSEQPFIELQQEVNNFFETLEV